jgi:CBS domain-containing protein
MGQSFSLFGQPNAFYKLLQDSSITCQKLLPKKLVMDGSGVFNTFNVRPETMISEALKKFLAHGEISSALIIDHHGDAIGWLDWRDLASFACFVLVAEEVRSLYPPAGEEGHLGPDAKRERICSRLVESNVRAIVDFSGRDELLKLNGNAPPLEAARLMKGGLRRILLTKDDGKPLGVLSQSDLCRDLYLQLFLPSTKSVGLATLKDFKLAHRRVHSVNQTETIRDALSLMQQKKISCAAVVDKDSGAMLGNFSATDLRHLFVHLSNERDSPKEEEVSQSKEEASKPENVLDMMFEAPVGKYLAQCSPKSLECATLFPHSTVDEALSMLMTRKIHHLFVVDEKNKPIGVVGMTDIIGIIFK